MPTRPCYKNGKYVEGYIKDKNGNWIKEKE